MEKFWVAKQNGAFQFGSKQRCSILKKSVTQDPKRSGRSRHKLERYEFLITDDK